MWDDIYGLWIDMVSVSWLKWLENISLSSPLALEPVTRRLLVKYVVVLENKTTCFQKTFTWWQDRYDIINIAVLNNKVGGVACQEGRRDDSLMLSGLGLLFSTSSPPVRPLSDVHKVHESDSLHFNLKRVSGWRNMLQQPKKKRKKKPCFVRGFFFLLYSGYTPPFWPPVID